MTMRRVLIASTAVCAALLAVLLVMDHKVRERYDERLAKRTSSAVDTLRATIREMAREGRAAHLDRIESLLVWQQARTDSLLRYYHGQ